MKLQVIRLPAIDCDIVLIEVTELTSKDLIPTNHSVEQIQPPFASLDSNAIHVVTFPLTTMPFSLICLPS